MKLKKILAMVLTIAMALSVCSVTALAGTAFELEIGQTSTALSVADTAATNISFASSNAAKASVNATSGVVTGVSAGYATITASYTTGTGLPGSETWYVTVNEGTISSVYVDGSATLDLPYGITYNAVCAELAKVKLKANNNRTTFEIANDAVWSCYNYTGAVGSTNTFTATVRNKPVSVAVRIVPADIQVDFGITSTIQVPQGTSLYALNLPTEATVKLLQGGTWVPASILPIGPVSIMAM